MTGSIVFVSDHSVFANHLWDAGDADLTGKQQCGDIYIENGHSCWDTDPDGLVSAQGDTAWEGNQLYFRALIRDMMEFDNDELSFKSHETQTNSTSSLMKAVTYPVSQRSPSLKPLVLLFFDQ